MTDEMFLRQLEELLEREKRSLAMETDPRRLPLRRLRVTTAQNFIDHEHKRLGIKPQETMEWMA